MSQYLKAHAGNILYFSDSLYFHNKWDIWYLPEFVMCCQCFNKGHLANTTFPIRL